MKPRISVLTLSVADLEQAVAFYRDGLGFKTEGIVGREFEHGAVAFFDLDHGLRLALWPRTSLSADTGLTDVSRSHIEFSLGHNVASAAEVDEVMIQVAKAGAKIVKSAQATFWGGYAGYFQDPDGHIWEVVFNPGVDEEQGDDHVTVARRCDAPGDEPAGVHAAAGGARCQGQGCALQ